MFLPTHPLLPFEILTKVSHTYEAWLQLILGSYSLLWERAFVLWHCWKISDKKSSSACCTVPCSHSSVSWIMNQWYEWFNIKKLRVNPHYSCFCRCGKLYRGIKSSGLRMMVYFESISSACKDFGWQLYLIGCIYRSHIKSSDAKGMGGWDAEVGTSHLIEHTSEENHVI